MQVRHIVNRAWEELASPRTALLILVVLFLTQTTALVLPQIPVPASESTAYNRWLAEFRSRVGPRTATLASLGLLTIRSSLITRMTLGLLSLLIASHLDRLLTPSWEQPTRRASGLATAAPDRRADKENGSTYRERAAHALFIAGGILAIVGWIAQMMWGWREPGVITWPGAKIELPQRALAFEQPTGFLGIWKGRMGIYVLNRGERTGLEVNATQDGAPMLLLPSVNEPPEEVLHLALTAQEPEAYFATEEATLIFRLIQLPDAIQVQAYRSPSGEIVAETLLSGADTPLVLNIDTAEITITPVSLPDYEVIYNPGVLFEVSGMALLVTSTLSLFNLSRKRSRNQTSAASKEDEA